MTHDSYAVPLNAQKRKTIQHVAAMQIQTQTDSQTSETPSGRHAQAAG